jgi:hypothetical protein
MLICRTTAKEKSRRTADTFPRAYVAAALIFQSRRFVLLFGSMLMQSGGRYMGGYRHVNFRHSQHP